MSSHVIKKDRLSIDVLPEMHKKIKVFAAYQGKSIREYVLESIKDRIKRDAQSKNIPNEATIQTFEETDTGKNIIEAKSIDDLFNQLGI